MRISAFIGTATMGGFLSLIAAKVISEYWTAVTCITVMMVSLAVMMWGRDSDQDAYIQAGDYWGGWGEGISYGIPPEEDRTMEDFGSESS